MQALSDKDKKNFISESKRCIKEYYHQHKERLHAQGNDGIKLTSSADNYRFDAGIYENPEVETETIPPKVKRSTQSEMSLLTLSSIICPQHAIKLSW